VCSSDLCISPWNFPLAIFVGQVSAALAAGNPVVAKPAEQTPLIAAEAVRILRRAGIPPEVEKRLFDPFFSTKATGTGLGLPIAARIVETHGGLLQYQTRPGHGTTFGVVLPRELSDTAGRAKPSASIPSGRGPADA
jgi:hypothetical protein